MPLLLRRYSCALVLAVMCLQVLAQPNLVPNPSFEEYNECPHGGISGIASPSPLSRWTKNWYSNPWGSWEADYFHTCGASGTDQLNAVPSNFSGYQMPRTGNAYTGFVACDTVVNPMGSYSYNRSFVMTKLNAVMQQGAVYQVSFYVSLAINKHIRNPLYRYYNTAAINSLGMHLGPDSFDYSYASYYYFSPDTATIQSDTSVFIEDTLGWTKVEGYYTAKGGEQWIAIGSFRNLPYKLKQILQGGSNGWTRSYYYLDDVSIIPVPGRTIDTTVCARDGFTFGKRAFADSCRWNDGDTSSTRRFAAGGSYWLINYMGSSTVTDSLHLTWIDTTAHVTDTSLCAGAAITLRVAHNGSYVWNTGAATQQITVSAAGVYYVTSQVPTCAVTDSFYVHAHPLPVINTVKDTVVCFAEVKQILLDAGRFKSYLWKPTGETTQTIYSTRAEVYLLTVTDTNTCSAQKGFAVMETCPETIFIPNVFTPDGDGLNDVFEIKGNAIACIHLKIMNRWGEVVFQSTDLSHTWDGTYKDQPCMADAYVYLVTYCFTGDNRVRSDKGSVTLLR